MEYSLSEAAISSLMWTNVGRRFTKICGKITSNSILILKDVIFPNTRWGMNGHRLLITTISWLAFSIRDNSTGTPTYSGLCIDIVEVLAEAYNFSYTLREPADGKFGAIVNGSWIGAVGDMVRHKTDLIAVCLSVEADRQKVIDFTSAFYHEEFGILMRRRDEFYVQSDIVITPFRWMIWLIIFFMIPGAAMFLSWTNVLAKNIRNERPTLTVLQTLHKNTFIVFGSFLRQGVGYHYFSTLVGQTFFVFWSVFAMIIVAFYTSQLVALLSVVKEQLPFTDIKGLVNQREYTWAVCDSCVVSHVMENSKIEEYNQIIDGKSQFRTSEGRLYNGIDNIKKALVDKHVYLADYAMQYTAKEHACDTLFLDRGFLKFKCGLGLPKGSPLVKDFSEKIMQLDESGILHLWLRKWNLTNLQCERKENVANRITIPTIHTAFYIVFTGVARSAIVLLIEVFCMSKRRE